MATHRLTQFLKISFDKVEKTPFEKHVFSRGGEFSPPLRPWCKNKMSCPEGLTRITITTERTSVQTLKVVSPGKRICCKKKANKITFEHCAPSGVNE